MTVINYADRGTDVTDVTDVTRTPVTADKGWNARIPIRVRAVPSVPSVDEWETLCACMPSLAELADKVSKATPPSGWRFWRHRQALRRRLQSIIDPATDWTAYATAIAYLLRLWETDAADAAQKPNGIEGDK